MTSPSSNGSSLLQAFLNQSNKTTLAPGPVAYYAALDQVASVSPTIAASIVCELRDQRSNIKLIASENYSSLATQLAHGNLLTDKYAEGFAGHRFYAGCANVDRIEQEASDLACQLFGADHAYVQPHSGSDANLVAFVAALSAKVEHPLLEELGQTDPSKLCDDDWRKIREAIGQQKLLAMDYYAGGHLTHGYRHNFSSILFDARVYGVDPVTGLLDLDVVREKARELKPFILLAGYSAYPRKINFAKFREIADEVGAIFMVDMAHFAGLVAGGVFEGDYNPVPHAHIVTSTSHKTLRGPRGGFILCKDEFAEWIDKGCPVILGGPLPHAMAAKAVAFREALQPEFRDYAARIVENSRSLAEGLIAEGLPVMTGGTDNHLMLVNVHSGCGITGRQAESAVRQCGFTVNRNSLASDPNGPWYTSGLRLGVAAATTLGMGSDEMKEISRIVSRVLTNVTPNTITGGPKAGEKSKAKYTLDAAVEEEALRRVAEITSQYPVYPELDLEFMLDWCQKVAPETVSAAESC